MSNGETVLPVQNKGRPQVQFLHCVIWVYFLSPL